MLKVDVTSWRRQIEANAKRVLNAGDNAFEKSAELLKERVEYYTPVGNPSLWQFPAPKGYTPGYLKSNWKLTKLSKEIILSNDAPYALRVENGWSSQAPSGMLRRAWMDYPRLLEQAAREQRL